MTSSIDDIREKIRSRVIQFIEENQGERKGLLIKLPCGTGKSRIASETLFSRDDIHSIFLCPRHPTKNDEDNIIAWNPGILHLKGRHQKGMCRYLDIIREASEYNVNISEHICKKCDELKDKNCPYYQQFDELEENLQSWIGVHHHLNINFIQRCFARSNFPFNVLVIDEYCIDNIISNKSFMVEDIDRIGEVIGIQTRNGWNDDEVEAVISILFALKFVILKTQKNIKAGNDFINSFIKYLKLFTRAEEQTWRDIEKILSDDKSMIFFKNTYSKVLYDIFQKNDKENYFKDILFEVIDIAQKCFRYYSNPPNRDFNLPFYSEKKKKENSKLYDKRIIYNSFSKYDIPDVPIIILDATGEKKVYEDAFRCEFEVYDVELPIKRNIIQVMDGFYWYTYFKNKDARNGLFYEISMLIKHHLSLGEKHINIITLRKIELQLQAYLINVAGIEKDKFTIHHYGNVKGSNEFIQDNILILLGTPEPHIWDFLMQISVLYEGKPILSNERIVERKESDYYGHDYRYKDKRYYSHIKMKRENEIKQDIDRVRWVLINNELELKKKRVYLYSMADIDYSTKKVTRKEMMVNIDPKFRINKKIGEAKRNSFYVYLNHLQDGDTKTTLYHKL